MSDPGEPTGQDFDYQPDGPAPSPRIGLCEHGNRRDRHRPGLASHVALRDAACAEEWGILVVAAAAIAVGLVCRLLMPAATARLGRHVDLLLPLGFYIPTETMLGLLAKRLSRRPCFLLPGRSRFFPSVSPCP